MRLLIAMLSTSNSFNTEIINQKPCKLNEINKIYASKLPNKI